MKHNTLATYYVLGEYADGSHHILTPMEPQTLRDAFGMKARMDRGEVDTPSSMRALWTICTWNPESKTFEAFGDDDRSWPFPTSRLPFTREFYTEVMEHFGIDPALMEN